MPAIKCKGCGRLTNTATSKFNRGNPPEVCYAAYENDKWVKGCGFEDAPEFEKNFAKSFIGGGHE